jgi:hypothetical protein
VRTERGNPQRLQRNVVALVSTLQLCDQQFAAPEHERQIVEDRGLVGQREGSGGPQVPCGVGGAAPWVCWGIVVAPVLLPDMNVKDNVWASRAGSQFATDEGTGQRHDITGSVHSQRIRTPRPD